MRLLNRPVLVKPPGKDSIPAEIFKVMGPGPRKHHTLLNNIWEEDMTQEFRDATIVPLFKNKGNKSDSGNYRGIFLFSLSIAGRLLARIILNSFITTITEENLPEAQCGFRPGRSTVDMIFAVHQVQEKCKEQNLDLNAVFIDLDKDFDTVSREALWTIIEEFGCPKKVVKLIRLFHDQMTGMVPSGRGGGGGGIRDVRNIKWCQTGVCAGPNSLQSVLHLCPQPGP